MAAPPDRVVVAVVHLTEGDDIGISIIIPTLNEAEHIGDTLESLFASSDETSFEVLICDGGSSDDTLDIAQRFPCHIVTSKPGRALQMNQGSRQASGRWLIFLHADSRLPNVWQQSFIENSQWGFFPIRLSGKRQFLRILEKAICLRSSLSKIATGDQALFFQGTFFKQLGGFAEIPIMEDIDISKRARQLGNPSIAKHPVITSSRRWEQQGIAKTIVLMWWLRLAYWFGTSPEKLHRLYYPNHCR